MKRKLIMLILVLVQGIGSLVAQKKLITFGIPRWPKIQDYSINSDGKYVKYIIEIPDSGSKFFVQSTNGSRKKELTGVSESFFTNDNRKLVFMGGKDSLGIMDLETNNIRYIPEVYDLQVPKEGSSTFIAYKKTGLKKTAGLLNLVSDEEKTYENVEEYFFDKKGVALVTTTTVASDSNGTRNVFWHDLISNETIGLCHSCIASNFTFSDDGTELAFLTQGKKDGKDVLLLRYFKRGMDSAEVAASPASPGMQGMSIAHKINGFNKTGDKIFFTIERDNNTDGKGDKQGPNINTHVDIYGPDVIQSASNLAEGRFTATLDLNDRQQEVTRLQQDVDNYLSFSCMGDWIVTGSNITRDPHYATSNVFARPDVYLISPKNGSRRLLEKRMMNCGLYFSPSGKYVIWFDQVKRQWFSHNIALNRTINMTRRLNEPVYLEDDHPDFPRAEEPAGWLESDKGVLIYGREDIWQVDLEGKRPPVNLTKSYGKRYKIRFRRIRVQKLVSPPITSEDTLVLSAFNIRTKQDGFFRLVMGSGQLEKLVMSSHLYNDQGEMGFPGAPSIGPFVKAKNAGVYVLPRMSASEYPNLYVTTDFQEFRPLTDLAPQKAYNWYTTELIRWKLQDGKPAEGILFKPENFDPRKKYPIIFYYYEKFASNLNAFIYPEPSEGPMSISWFVSNGYLVFVPDIYCKTGHPGQSALNSVISAAMHLSKKPWIDREHMGLQGHSYGGFETNYIVSHSSLFKAAAPASGVSNEISSYGDPGFQWFYEFRQGRIGATLWQQPELYVENSPVFNANKLTADVLIMHTKNDVRVPYTQGWQWYTNLKRLGKKVWLLSYDGEDHSLKDRKDQLDYSIRLGQFFDYELKGTPPPRWMIGLANPAKGDLGYELDTSGVKPQ
ncbi:MAG TPA: prolyl oligopeptidase family serine peptidase [Mucilaginibacter sp.]|jgi:dipeptidyl aminopeptidase/acylaminoacyl peptidase|nr:prolyl oligopeptidase family serine peptidase [Mucilaginibacter sp.]